jgi:hypothetical protein
MMKGREKKQQTKREQKGRKRASEYNEVQRRIKEIKGD